jgi:SNF2 family DNA or RNA helicase
MKLIDNINSFLGDELKASLRDGAKLKIAASCFSIFAYESLKTELSKLESLEFIFTAPTFIPNQVSDNFKKERREFFIPKVDRERSLYGSDFEIQLRNKMTQRAIARECAEWIRNKVTFRSNKTKAPMQQFLTIDGTQSPSAFFPLSGFTAVDLGYQPSNAVSNFTHKIEDPSLTTTYLTLFEEIWNDPEKLQDVTDIICDHVESVYHENSPERIYFLILYNIFNDFLSDIDEDNLPNDKTGYQETAVWKKLFNFQRDAAVGIINKLETYNGCILADSVGLGKTFTALAVIKYYELRNKSVLVLVPKKLADNWLNYNRNLKTNIFSADRFSYDVLCHTDLSRTSGQSFGMPLNRVNWGNYDLVVIDESHNFRNNEALKNKETRYQRLMNRVIREGVKTKVLMLSATPVNNRFNDLRNQLALAYEGDSNNFSKHLKGHRGVEEIFRQAQKSFNIWAKLPAEERTPKALLDQLPFDFFDLLDSVTIARSRKHIETFYNTEDIGNFPERLKPMSFHPPLTDRTDDKEFNEIYEDLTKLKLSVYASMSYILPSRLGKYEELYDTELGAGRGRFKQIDRDKYLQALMTINLLKRLESSVESFRLTLLRLKKKHEATLQQITLFEQSGRDGVIENWPDEFGDTESDGDFEEEIIDFDDEPGFDEFIGGKVKINLKDMDLESWKRDLSTDLAIIDGLYEQMLMITPEEDAKLQHLKGVIKDKIENPINGQNKKILIFTAFADTANYLYENLAPLMKNIGIHSAKVTGSATPKSTLSKGYDFQTILTLFSPISKEKHLVIPEEPNNIDLLIGTDCISEGQNLQDCDFLVNYDIHWNPVRIIQRFGRIDRIGSKNAVIQLVNYWPDITLDEYINLKNRVENRMIMTDITATGDDNVLTAKSTEMSYRHEQLRRLQDEVIDMEEVKTGVSITDLGLNDFRMDLLNYVKEEGELDLVPKGLHAVVHSDPEKGLHPGVIFALRNLSEGVGVNMHNRLHPHYLVFVGRDGKVILDQTNVKKLLDLIRSSCKGEEKPIAEACRLFNKETDEGKDMSRYSELLGSAIRSMVDVKEEKDIDSLFTDGETTALVDTFSGLDDFELVAFLIIQ